MSLRTSLRVLVAGVLAGACVGHAALAQTPQDADLVRRGAYLARAADCVACHTAKGGQPYAGGYPVSTPFGTIYVPNITPDRATGIGGWSDDQFVRAVRQGVGAHGENLYPAMPYNSYAKMSRPDVLAIKAFLFSLAPVQRPKLHNALLFPLNVRPVLSMWKLFNPRPADLQDDPARSVEWNRGRYLVEAAGHCGECHSPRTLTEGENTKRYLGGGSLGAWTAFNITSDPRAGIGAWSQDEIVQFLATGHNAHAGASGPMAEAVENSTRFLTPADLKAMAVYLKTVPPIGGSSGPVRAEVGAPADPAVEIRGGPVRASGAELYLGNCATCHGADGAGRGTGFGAYPALFHRSAVGARDPHNLVSVILGGVQRTTNAGQLAMPAFADQLDDQQAAVLANYVRTTFGAGKGGVTPSMVASLRRGPSIVGLQILEIMAAVAALAVVLAVGGWIAVGRGRKAVRPGRRPA
jgi:mono/diheme cytochrome c family protein